MKQLELDFEEKKEIDILNIPKIRQYLEDDFFNNINDDFKCVTIQDIQNLIIETIYSFLQKDYYIEEQEFIEYQLIPKIQARLPVLVTIKNIEINRILCSFDGEEYNCKVIINDGYANINFDFWLMR